MNRTLKLAAICSSIVISVIFGQLAEAKSVTEEIKETGVLKVGVREDSPLFGFGADKMGYCRDFANELAKSLGKQMGKNIQVELVTSTTQNRWDLVKNGTIHFECGPNTITPEREKEYGVIFSSRFFMTATQVFVKFGITEGGLSNGRIGVIKDTTNEGDIRQFYSQDKIDNSFTRRSHGISAVQLREIDGFASDGILLMGTALALEINLQKYTFVTPMKDGRPFCAAYGMILPAGEDNSQWRKIVNEFIDANEQGSQVWDTWFTNSLPYIGAVMSACQTDQ